MNYNSEFCYTESTFGAGINSKIFKKNESETKIIFN